MGAPMRPRRRIVDWRAPPAWLSGQPSSWSLPLPRVSELAAALARAPQIPARPRRTPRRTIRGQPLHSPAKARMGARGRLPRVGPEREWVPGLVKWGVGADDGGFCCSG